MRTPGRSWVLAFSVVMGHGAEASAQVNAAAPGDATIPRLVRVRSDNPEVAAVISRASETSTTFQRLIAAIDGTDGLVYVDDGKCGHGVQACLVLSVQVAGPFRLLHIRIDARRPDCRLMASIGHELQHAIEILSDPSVTNGAAAYLFYDRIAGQGVGADRGRFETAAADRAGLEVRREACKARDR